MKKDKPNIYDISKIFWIYDEDLHSHKFKKRGKPRPVIITAFTSNGQAVLNKITTKYKNKPKEYKIRYYEIEDLNSAHLDKKSYIDIFNPRTIPLEKLKNRIIGELAVKDIVGLMNFKKEYPKRLKALRDEEKANGKSKNSD